MADAPKVLIFLLSGQWMGISRLPRALVDAGFHVVTLSPVGSYLSLTRYAHRHISMPPGAHPVEFFVRTVHAAQPDLIIPGCDTTVLFLQNFEKSYRVQVAAGGKPQAPQLTALLDLVRRSLGDPAGYAATTNKNMLLQKLRELKIPSPDYTEVSSAKDAGRFADAHGYPIVLKSEQGSGGVGVRICSTLDEIEAGLRELASEPVVMPDVAGQRMRIVAQKFVHGTPAMQVVCAMNGKILERMQVLKQERLPGPNGETGPTGSTGPSSVVRFIEHEAMDASVRKLVAGLGFSGFAGIDFMVEEGTQRAYLIELNPRPCPISHLGHRVGRNLARALWCQITNTPYTREKVDNPPPCIALFPQERQRDPQSPALTEIFHDIPQDDPALLQALME